MRIPGITWVMLGMLCLTVFIAWPRTTGTSCGPGPGGGGLSAMKQVGVGLMLYLQDSDDVLPQKTWMDDIYPYIKSEDILRCIGVKSGYGEALSKAFAGKNVTEIEDPLRAMVFESKNLSRNAVEGLDTFDARHIMQERFFGLYVLRKGIVVSLDTSTRSVAAEDLQRYR
jgi:hypothetical protein